MNVVFGKLSRVLYALAGEDILDKGLLQECVPDVFFIPEHILNSAVRPLLTAAGCRYAVRFKVLANLTDAVAHQIAGENATDDGGLFLVDLRLPVRTLSISEKAFVLVVDLAVLEVATMSPAHIFAEGLTLGLRL